MTAVVVAAASVSAAADSPYEPDASSTGGENDARASPAASESSAALSSARRLTPNVAPAQPSAPSCPMSARPSELTQYSAKRPPCTRRMSMPPKVTTVPGAAVAPGSPPA
jgi:hypothetical protein